MKPREVNNDITERYDEAVIIFGSWNYIKLREIGTIQINKDLENKIVQLNFVLNVYRSNYLPRVRVQIIGLN